MSISLRLELINLRELEEELDYRENEQRTSHFDLRPWLVPAILICSAVILFLK